MKIKIDGGGYDGQEEATVEINRERRLISVRPKYARQVVTYPLDAVAKMLLWKAAKEAANAAVKLDEQLDKLE